MRHPILTTVLVLSLMLTSAGTGQRPLRHQRRDSAGPDDPEPGHADLEPGPPDADDDPPAHRARGAARLHEGRGARRGGRADGTVLGAGGRIRRPRRRRPRLGLRVHRRGRRTRRRGPWHGERRLVHRRLAERPGRGRPGERSGHPGALPQPPGRGVVARGGGLPPGPRGRRPAAGARLRDDGRRGLAGLDHRECAGLVRRAHRERQPVEHGAPAGSSGRRADPGPDQRRRGAGARLPGRRAGEPDAAGRDRPARAARRVEGRTAPDERDGRCDAGGRAPEPGQAPGRAPLQGPVVLHGRPGRRPRERLSCSFLPPSRSIRTSRR